MFSTNRRSTRERTRQNPEFGSDTRFYRIRRIRRTSRIRICKFITYFEFIFSFFSFGQLAPVNVIAATILFNARIYRFLYTFLTSLTHFQIHF